MILDHSISARRPKALLFIGGTWLVLWALWLTLDASPLLLSVIGLFTLPAVFEAARGDRFRLTIDTNCITWDSQRHSGNAPLRDIDHVRFDTRLDFAINARLCLVNGTDIRLPIECVPPYEDFCAALDEAGVRYERHHFGFF